MTMTTFSKNEDLDLLTRVLGAEWNVAIVGESLGHYLASTGQFEVSSTLLFSSEIGRPAATASPQHPSLFPSTPLTDACPLPLQLHIHHPPFQGRRSTNDTPMCY